MAFGGMFIRPPGYDLNFLILIGLVVKRRIMQCANNAAFSAQTLIRGFSIWPAYRAPDFRRLSGERLRLFIFSLLD
jgi:hypothetical protein